MLKRKKPLKRTNLLRKTKLRSVSKKMAQRKAEYMKVREQYLKAHPYCEWWLAFYGVLACPRSTQIHHKKGRVGALLTDPAYFMAVSNEGHRYIHDNPKESYERGWMLPR
jgi:hypothetical protein